MSENDKKVQDELEDLQANPQVTFNEDGTKTIRLMTPVKFGDKTIDSITFRKPTGHDWRETDKETGEVGKSFRLAAAIGDISITVLDRMDGEDALLCARVAGTMGKKLLIGGKL